MRGILKAHRAARSLTSPGLFTALGDSYVAQAQYNGISGLDLSLSPNSFIPWLLFFSKQQLYMPLANLFGYSGATTDTILTHLDAALATRPGFLDVSGGTNDELIADASRTVVADHLAKLQGAFGKALNQGTIPITRTITPRPGLTAEQEQWRQDVNTGYRAMAAAGLCLCADIEGVLYGGTGDFIANRTTDNVHFAAPGAAIAGKLYWDMISPYISTPYAPVGNGLSNLLANSSLAGSAGSNSGTGASGSVPTSWTNTGAGASGGSSVASAVAATDGGHDWTQLLVTGGSGTFLGKLKQNVAGVNVGDTIICKAEVECETASLASAAFFVELAASGATATRARHFFVDDPTKTLADDGATTYRGILQTWAWQVPAAFDGVTLEFNVSFETVAGQGAKLRVRDPGVYKLS